MVNSQKINFLYQSIADTQGTIRALDVKTGFLFVVTFIPLPGLDDIFGVFVKLTEISSIYLAMIVFVSILWFLSVISIFRCAISISSPNRNIDGSLPEGLFYTSSLYNFNFIDNFFNFPIKSNFSFEEYLGKVPGKEEDIVRELAFEKMKLAYIRDIKIKRSGFCTVASFAWLVGGGLIWMSFLLEVRV